VRAAFLRLGHDTTPERLAAAVLEGVAFAHADGLAVLREAGSEIEALSVIGGGARSQHWGRIFAAMLDVPLLYLEGGEVGPALGAAKLAQVAYTGCAASEICVRPAIEKEVLPDRSMADRLAPSLAAFRAAYAAIHKL
jgi:xylulokinase